MKHLILGCGDVGRRIALQLIAQGASPQSITATVVNSIDQAKKLGIKVNKLDLDQDLPSLKFCDKTYAYYTIAPQKEGVEDQRSRGLIAALEEQNVLFKRLVLISTTGVYGDCQGEWVDELTPTAPQTERGQRRLDSEQQWLAWGEKHSVPVMILRAPGIYAFSRLPRKRLEAGTPVVKAEDCGFTNRIHADDLAMVCLNAMELASDSEVYNATDGTPGKITEYLQAAAQVLNFPALKEISMSEAQKELSAGMLSYLGESRKISNKKMLDELAVTLRYPNFKEGIKVG